MSAAQPTGSVRRSDELHSRVQKWISDTPAEREPFERLALDIAQFQAQFSPGYARLVSASGARLYDLDDLDALPPVPVEAFRLTRIAVHDTTLDEVRYLTSGTTSGERGMHAMRRTDTYRLSAVTWGRRALLPPPVKHAAVVALLPEGSPSTSSLGAMAQMFIDAFDSSEPSNVPSRWLLREQAVDVAALQAHLRRARALDQPLLVVATAFALVHLLDNLGQRRIDGWPQTIVMPTGGFKGKSREVALLELRAGVAQAFNIDSRQVVGEYGMTELSSQLYEGSRQLSSADAMPGVYFPPAWLNVRPVDAETFKPVAAGHSGLARFIDLANVDSALCIVTQDVIRERAGGIELLGRQMGAPSRGCSLSTEEWLSAQRAG